MAQVLIESGFMTELAKQYAANKENESTEATDEVTRQRELVRGMLETDMKGNLKQSNINC